MRIGCVLTSVLAGTAALLAQGPPPRVAPRDFAVMAWGGSPSDPAQLKEMREAGLNISGFCAPPDLDRVHDAGLTCFVRDRRFNGFAWDHLPDDAQLRPGIAELKTQLAGKPAALGFYLNDEPSTALMPGLGRMAALLRESMPDLWPYVNLLPYHVNASMIGSNDYDSYVRKLVDTIHQPFLSYDNYSLVDGQMLNPFFTNLEIFRRLAIETKTPFWNCVLSNAHFNYMEPSDATFHLQAYGTMAYGGRGIQYFTYFALRLGNYRLSPIDQWGNKTATYDMMRRINNEIHALAPTLIHLRSTGVYHSPDVPEQGRPLSDSRLVQGVTMTQRLVRTPTTPRFLVGEFEDEQQRPYVMLVNKDLAQSFRFAIQWKTPGPTVRRISPYSGREEPFGREMDWLAPGAGVLLRIENPR
jgi:hypothetical protein